LAVLALAARALSVSFLLLASATLASNYLVLLSRASIAFFYWSNYALKLSASSWYAFFFTKASRAKPSSPLASANSALLSHSSARL